MGIDVNQWRARIGLWHAFTVGRPLAHRRRCFKPLNGRMKKKKHEYKRTFKARHKGKRATLQQTRARTYFLPLVALLTLVVVFDSRSDFFNNLLCQLTSACVLPPIRLALMLFLVGSEKCGSEKRGWVKRKSAVEKRKIAGMETTSFGRLLGILLILAGDVELNPGPVKLGMISIIFKLLSTLVFVLIRLGKIISHQPLAACVGGRSLFTIPYQQHYNIANTSNTII